jgi:hypothetical protein
LTGHDNGLALWDNSRSDSSRSRFAGNGAAEALDQVGRRGIAELAVQTDLLELVKQGVGLLQVERIRNLREDVSTFGDNPPSEHDFVRESIPAKISSLCLARNRQLSASRILSWASRYPEWPDTLKAAVGQPAAQ